MSSAARRCGLGIPSSYGGLIDSAAVCPNWDSKAVDFESLTEKVETDSAAGTRIFHMLDDKQAHEIKALLRDPDIQAADVARRYGVARTTLYNHIGVIVSRAPRNRNAATA